jgi:hypothetical protein
MSQELHIYALTIGTALGLILFCGVAMAWCALLDEWLKSEDREVARRAAEDAKRQADAEKWNFLSYPRKDRSALIPRSHIDSAHRSGMFSIPRPMRDMKGVWR